MSRLSALLTSAVVALGTAVVAVPPATPAGAAPPDGRGTLDAPDRSALEGLGATEGLRSDVPASGRYSFLLQLGTRSTGRVYAAAAKTVGGVSAAASARAQLVRVRAAQDAVVRALPSRTPVLYRTHAALAAVAVTTNVKNRDDLARIPGVAKVYPIAPKYPDTSYAVGLQSGPAAWQGNATIGADITIAVIDTGIDYTHATFGGAGTSTAYDTEHALADSGALGAFPTAKVIGGYDLVGDAYNSNGTGAALVPHPDPNPLDCNGHGSHVAGIAAGQGVNADGSTYTGTYDNATDIRHMRIGPGMAPQAKLMAFRVFGCTGSTNVAGDAIDRALDPNDDGSIADAVDVMNLSLGSDYGTTDDGDTAVADAAAGHGVSMVFSAGNSYDLYDIGGSPGTSQRGITVASSADASSVGDGIAVTYSGGGGDTFASQRAALYDWSAGPDLTGVVAEPTTNTTGCTAFTGGDQTAISGKIALLSWNSGTPECGSIARAGNVQAAGAIGYIFVETSAMPTTAINGNAAVPGVIVTSAAGAAIRAKLAAPETVTVTGTVPNGLETLTPTADDTVSSFSSRGIRGNGHLKPDVAAVGDSVFSAAVGTGNLGKNIGGTSMAAPMVAGLAALVRSAHPDWNPEQVKAGIMNTAGQNLDTNGSGTAGGDRYAPNRVGAGRIQADKAVETDLLAYVLQDPGAVSVSFGPLEVTAPMTLTKTVRIQNTGPTARTFTMSYDPITTVPGVSYDLAASSFAVPAGESEQVTVTLRIDDPSLLTKTVDATHGRLYGASPAEFLADASGNLVITPNGASAGRPTLRVPVYSAPRPASVMTQPDELVLEDDEGTLALDGQEVFQGSGSALVASLTAGLELTAESLLAPTCGGAVTTYCVSGPSDRGADLEYVGVTSDAPYYVTPSDGQAYFGIATHGVRPTAASRIQFVIYLDTNEDGAADLISYTTRVEDKDQFVVNLARASDGEVLDTALTNNRLGNLDTAIFDSDVLLMPVWLDELLAFGVNEAAPRVNYGIVTFGKGTVDRVGMTGGTVNGSLSADLYEPGLLVTGDGVATATNTAYGPVVTDFDGEDLIVERNPESYEADGGLGLLMLHFHNKAGNKAQVVDARSEAEVSLDVGSNPATAGQATSLSVTVDDPDGSAVPTGAVTVRDTITNTVVASGTLTAGSATLSYAPGGVGGQNLVATYDGDSLHFDATSAPVPVTVVAGASPSPAATATLSVTPSTVERGTEVALGVAVSGSGSTPTGAVSVKDAGTGEVLATGTLASGAATLQFTPTTAGTRSLVATYAGDGVHPAATSDPVTLTVTPAARDVMLTASRTSVVRGKQVLLTVGVATEPGDPVPTGAVTVVDGTGETVASGALGPEGWVLLLPYRPENAGTVRLRATYAGDANTVASGPSRTVAIDVAKSPSNVRLSLAWKRGKVGDPVKAEVSVRLAGVGSPWASGEIRIRAKGRTIARVDLVGGHAFFEFTPTRVGKLRLRAVYGGDAAYTKGSSAVKTFTVLPASGRH